MYGREADRRVRPYWVRVTGALAVYLCLCECVGLYSVRFINAVVHFCNLTPDRATVVV